MHARNVNVLLWGTHYLMKLFTNADLHDSSPLSTKAPPRLLRFVVEISNQYIKKIDRCIRQFDDTITSTRVYDLN